MTSKQHNILKYPWHTGHDYELAKLPHQFFYLTSTHREWATKQRPVPSNISWVGHMQEEETDVMILHVDQWTWHEAPKRRLFETLKAQYDGPKIVINHGCNMVDGCTSEQMRELLSGCHVVCNSATAHELWDLPDSRFIRHGMSPGEWGSTSYARRNIIIIQAHSRSHTAYRNFDGVSQAEEKLDIEWIGRDKTFSSFNAYRRYVQTSSILFNPSYASCNPRSRTEAMLSGLVVVTTDSHGESEYIENGVNGFASNDMGELIDFMEYLIDKPEEIRKIGQAGRKTAQEFFHIQNFISQWEDLLNDIV